METKRAFKTNVLLINNFSNFVKKIKYLLECRYGGLQEEENSIYAAVYVSTPYKLLVLLL